MLNLKQLELDAAHIVLTECVKKSTNDPKAYLTYSFIWAVEYQIEKATAATNGSATNMQRWLSDKAEAVAEHWKDDPERAASICNEYLASVTLLRIKELEIK